MPRDQGSIFDSVDSTRKILADPAGITFAEVLQDEQQPTTPNPSSEGNLIALTIQNSTLKTQNSTLKTTPSPHPSVKIYARPLAHSGRNGR
jgi:hypothetical protein